MGSEMCIRDRCTAWQQNLCAAWHQNLCAAWHPTCVQLGPRTCVQLGTRTCVLLGTRTCVLLGTRTCGQLGFLSLSQLGSRTWELPTCTSTCIRPLDFAVRCLNTVRCSLIPLLRRVHLRLRLRVQVCTAPACSVHNRSIPGALCFVLEASLCDEALTSLHLL